MSLARLIAMLASRPRAEFIGWAAGGEFATTASLPAGAKVGDLMVITYYSGANIGGGSGTAFNTQSFTNMKVSSRVIEAGDLVSPITFTSHTTPYITGVWRGPTSVSSPRTSQTILVSGDYNLTGFAPSANALAIFAAGQSSTGVPTFAVTPTGIFEVNRTQSTSGFGYGTGAINTIETYTPNATFRLITDNGGVAEIFELLL